MTGLRRVVVTGVGMVSPLGAGVDNVWKRLLNAESGIHTIQGFDASHLPSNIGGEVPIVGGVRSDDPFALDTEAVMPDKERRRVDPITIYARAAATEAVEMSGWKPTDEAGQERTGVMIGSGIGGIASFIDAVKTVMTKGARRLSPFAIPAILVNLPSGHISMKYGFRGPNHANSTACTTGTHAIGDSARMIALGDAEVMVQKALSWAIREWTPVDAEATAAFLRSETAIAAAETALKTALDTEKERARRSLPSHEGHRRIRDPTRPPRRGRAAHSPHRTRRTRSRAFLSRARSCPGRAWPSGRARGWRRSTVRAARVC